MEAEGKGKTTELECCVRLFVTAPGGTWGRHGGWHEDDGGVPTPGWAAATSGGPAECHGTTAVGRGRGGTDRCSSSSAYCFVGAPPFLSCRDGAVRLQRFSLAKKNPANHEEWGERRSADGRNAAGSAPQGNARCRRGRAPAHCLLRSAGRGLVSPARRNDRARLLSTPVPRSSLGAAPRALSGAREAAPAE